MRYFRPLALTRNNLSKYYIGSRQSRICVRYRSSNAEMETVNTTQRLGKLRKLMQDRNLDVYIVPSEDSHASEYVSACDARRAYISGFSGSAGVAIVTPDKAALSTDGRYFNQAEKQLDGNLWTLLKTGLQDVPTWQEWTATQAEEGKVVGVDPTVISSSDARKLAEKIKKRGGHALRPVEENLIDLVWGEDRPSSPMGAVEPLQLVYAGKGVKEKLAELREELRAKHSAGFVVSMLDEVAWLFNLRGSDIPYNPVFFAYAVVTPEYSDLYVNHSKLSDSCKAYLAENKINVHPYEEIFHRTKLLASGSNGTSPVERVKQIRKKWLISDKASWALQLALGGDSKVDEIRSPISCSKAIKNETELEGMRSCHIRDGAALIEYFAWLENQLVAQKATIDEVTAADQLEAFRKKHELFVGLSFETISSTGANAAVIHYAPYRDGTTDTTRTLHFGEPSEMEIKAYTLVLKGHIALDVAIFPKGTSGFALDTLARQFLWAEGLDYRHGTGHGVGSFLNVHEGPIGIGTRPQYTEVPLAPGNVISNEPGYYQDGAFGVRIENIFMVREVETRHQFGEKPYLGFEHVTMVPYCRKLIDQSLLTSSEEDWLNKYHANVYSKTKGFFEEGSATLAWLERETATLRK